MVTARGALTVVLMLASACSPRSTERVAIAYNGSQARRAAVMTCKNCVYHDVGSISDAPSSADILIIDGHSNPPRSILDLPLIGFEAFVASVDPRVIVGVTCRFGDLTVLQRLFAASPRLDRIIASPARLPWDGYGGVANCIAAAPQIDPLTCLDANVYEYSRSDVERLVALAEDTLDDVRSCRSAPLVVQGRSHPPYLCLASSGGPAVAWRVELVDLVQRCGKGDPRPIQYVACAPGDDLPPRGASAS